MTTKTDTTYSTPVTEVMKKHVTIRSFRDEKIPDGMLREILEAGRRAPTSSNTQSYSMVVVRDPAKKEKLAELAGGQGHIIACDTYVAFVADIYRLEKAAAMHGQPLGKGLENFLVASVDASLVGQNVQTAAESFGLGAVMIGGMRNHPKEAAELLGLPQGCYIVYGMSIGWPVEDDIPAQKPRLPEELVIHWESYNTADPTEQLAAYDEALRTHYEEQGRNLNEAAWTGVIADRFNAPRRTYLKATLEAMGFVLD